MTNRRTLLQLFALALAGCGNRTAEPAPATDESPAETTVPADARLLLVHGRSQQGKDPAALKAEWLDALATGAGAAGVTLPQGLQVDFPFYGDLLDGFARDVELPLTEDIQARGESIVDADFLRFQAEMADELRLAAGITDGEIDAAYGENPRPKGPQNWEWVQAILRTLDRRAGGLSRSTLETFMRDVYLYTQKALVRDAIDEVVANELTEGPTVVVGHSLGSVVAYNVLRRSQLNLDVRLFITLGSPLAVRSIRDEFRPLRYPPASGWFNAFDERDVVALYPLDGNNFPVSPAIENYDQVDNQTGNRHGIVGYLDDRVVAQRIVELLSAG